jgi:hypothetical protein
MLTKLPIEAPKIIFKGTEDDFYSKNHYLELENTIVEFRYSQFYKNRLQNLSVELSQIKENDSIIKEENEVIHKVIGFFKNPIFYLKKDVKNSEYLILITFSESQPGLFWIGLESIWMYKPDSAFYG